jgi:FdhE protein
MGTVDYHERIHKAFTMARRRSAPYHEWYPFLEALFLAQAAGKNSIRIDPPVIEAGLARTKWEEGFPLLLRWDFPVDMDVAENILTTVPRHVPAESDLLPRAGKALRSALTTNPEHRSDIWRSFLQHEMEPWEEWVDTSSCDTASLLFWGRSCLRPSLEWSAERLLQTFALPVGWNKGYCPVCGSLPALLFLRDQGERHAYCSWCGSTWGLQRLQCPYCENRYHESLGYIFAEQEPQYRVQYCRLCKMYFKQIDLRELAHEPYFPLEEWTTVHLDFLAQREDLLQPPSPAPALYGPANRT